MLGWFSSDARPARLATFALSAALLAFGAAAPAAAGDGSVRPNYRFPGGLDGFKLVSRGGGDLNPGILVGFNPQPDPPGTPGELLPAVMPTFLDLTNEFNPVLNNAGLEGAWSFHFRILGHGDGAIDLPAAPIVTERGGFSHTSFDTRLDGHAFRGLISFGPGVVDRATWGSFNPQPDPPGFGFGAGFSFEGHTDPWASFSLFLDDRPLSFALAPGGVPEPATWGLMILGFGLAGGALRRRRSLTV